ncbi:unnamed protein product [Blepharisma stoltei]|uniref:Uncharacterized protein n=1 Tax=Blepharisma stoltei TaxID=1481888 RepID=A0AAU9K3Y1_9CILI|nr:unnamed protein product [Blepharisma stoltei]
MVLILVAISIKALNDFGTIYLTYNESTTLRLHDYFSQNEIDFYISNTNATEKDIILKHKSSLDLISYISTPLGSFEDNSTQFSQQFPYFELSEGIIFFRHDDNYLFSYRFSKNSQKIEKLWSMQVVNGTISQVIAFYILSTPYLLISSRFCTNSAWDLWESELYILELIDFINPGFLVKLDIWDIKYLSDFKIFAGKDNLNCFIISGKFNSGKQSLFFYKALFSNEINFYLVQSFDYYIGLAEFESNDLNAIQGIPTINQFLILDSKLGLFIYDSFHRAGLSFRGYLDLRKYGNLYSLSFILDLQLYIIGSDAGAILISSKLYHNEYSLITIYDVIGKLVPTINADKYGSLCFLQIELEESRHLLVFELAGSESAPPQFLGNFNLKKIVGNDFNRKGMWMLLQIESKTVYIRHDFDGIRIFALNLEDWTLKLWGNNSVYAEIIGKSNNSKKKIVKKSLNVISIPLGSHEIYSLNSAEHNKSIDLYLGLNNQYLSLIPQVYLSGPNLTYEIKSTDFSELFNACLITPKSEQTEILLPENTEKISLSYSKIACSSRNIIKFNKPNFILDLILPDSLNILNIIWTLNFNNYLIIEVEENLHYTIMVYRIDIHGNSYLFSKIHSNIDCLFFKSYNADGIEVFACADHENIDVYLISMTIEKWLSFDRECLKFDGNFWITGLEFFASQVLLPHKIFDIEILIYVAFFNEISLIKIRLDRFKGFINIDYKFADLQNEIIDLSITFDHIALLFADCKVGIYDRNLSIVKTLGPHYKGKAKGILARGLIIFIQVNNEILVYDWGFLAHDALKYSFLIGSSCRLANELQKELSFSNMEIPILCKTSEKFALEWYTLQCYSQYLYFNRCYNFGLIELKSMQELTKNFVKEGKISILAQNSVYHSTIEIKVNLHINGDKIWVDEAKFPSKLNVPYSRDKMIDLNSIVHGNNTYICTKINGLMYEDINLAYSPILLHRNFNEKLSLPLGKNNLSPGHFYVKAANKLILLTDSDSELIILNFNYENSTIDAQLALKYLVNSINIRCLSINTIDFDDNTILIFIICVCGNENEVLWNEKINRFYQKDRALILIVEYDYLRKQVLKSKYVPLFLSNYDLKSVKLSNQRFEIFLFEHYKTAAQSWINKHIIRFEGSRSKSTIEISKKEEIDTLSLGLDLFLVESADIVLSRFGQIFLYVIDSMYGLRIIRMQENGPAEIVGGITHQSPNYFKYAYSFRNLLYIITEKMELLEYIIDDFQTPALSRVFYSDSNRVWEILSIRLISYPASSYIIASFQKYDKGINLRIWNEYDWYDLLIEDALDVFAFESDLGEKNMLSFINIHNSTFNLISLDKWYINVPIYGQKRGEEIEKIWGTDEFRIQFYANNTYSNATSSVMVLKRGHAQSNNSPPWWLWIFMLAAAAIILFIIGHCVCYMRNKKNKRDYELINEGLMLKEINQVS